MNRKKDVLLRERETVRKRENEEIEIQSVYCVYTMYNVYYTCIVNIYIYINTKAERTENN